MILLSMQMFMCEMSKKLFYHIRAIIGIIFAINVNIVLEQIFVRVV